MKVKITSSRYLLLIVSLLVVASTGGPATAFTGTNATAANDQPTQLEIEMAGDSTSMDDGYASGLPVIQTNRTITFDNGTNYRLVYTNEDTAESATLRVDGNVSLDTFGDRGVASINSHEADGTARADPLLQEVSGSPVPLTVTNGSISSTTGLTNYSVALYDADTGNLVAQSAPRSYAFGYKGLLSANDTSGVVTLSMPRDVLPAGADATVGIYNASQEYWDENTTKVEKPLTYDASADAFTTSLDTTALPDGSYHWQVDWTLPGNGTFQQSSEWLDNASPFEFQNDGNDSPSSNPTVALESATLPLDDTTPLDLTLSDAPDGVSGYEITVQRTNRSVLGIDDVTFADGWSPTDAQYDPDTGITVKAADLNQSVEPGATNVSLATFEVGGKTGGSTNVSVTVRALDDDDGDVITAETVDGHVEVDTLVSVCEGCGTPTDPDGDGEYEDLNGNGRFDFQDVVVLSENLNSTAVTEHSQAFDFNSNGRIDADDVKALFDEH